MAKKKSGRAKSRKATLAKAHELREKRVRLWESTMPGMDFYKNPDLALYMERIKNENPDFREFMAQVESGAIDVSEDIRKMAKDLENELNREE